MIEWLAARHWGLRGAVAILSGVLTALAFEPYGWWPLVLPVETWNSLLGPLVPMAVKDQRFMQVNVPEARSRIFSYGVVPVRAVEVLIDLGRQARRPGVLAVRGRDEWISFECISSASPNCSGISPTSVR